MGISKFFPRVRPRYQRNWGIFIQTPEAKFVHTVDFRLTGYHPEKVDQLERAINQFEPAYAKVYQGFYPDADFLILSEDMSNDVGSSLENKLDYINLKSLKKDPELYLLQNAFENISILAALKPAIYLHTNGEPIGEYMPAYNQRIAYLQSIDIPFVSFGVSGHARQMNLLYIVNQIRTNNIILWHTFKPDYYGKLIANLGLQVVYPKYKKSYIV